jgi:hypothetical protein
MYGYGYQYGTIKGGTGLPFTPPLDVYTGAAAAYSLRLLRTAYAGSSIRVRRSSDNAESDIGFVSGVLDTATLLTFCGAGDGFVTTWHDQSGNARNATQTTAANQPQIVSSGSVLVLNTKSSINFDGTNDSFSQTLPNGFYGTNDFNIFCVTKNVSTSETGGITQKRNAVFDGNMGLGAASGRYQFQTRDTGTGDATINTVSTYATQQIVSVARDSVGINMYLPETLSALTSSADLTSTNASEIGTGNSYGALGGQIQEMITYATNQSANRAAIETNINEYYGIY